MQSDVVLLAVEKEGRVEVQKDSKKKENTKMTQFYFAGRVHYGARKKVKEGLQRPEELIRRGANILLSFAYMKETSDFKRFQNILKSRSKKNGKSR